MTDLSLRDTYRATDVFRWQIVKTHRKQSVAEHSFQVALIASRLCDVLGEPEETRNKAVWFALVHDLPEVLTGDLATPLKAMLGDEARSRLGDFEQGLTMGGRPISCDQRIKFLVKAADLIEAVAFLNQNGASSHAFDIEAKLAQKVRTFGEAPIQVMDEVLYSGITTLDDLMG